MRFRFMIAVLALQSLPAFAATVSILPPNLDIVAGQTFSVDIAISGVTDLYAYQFDLGFDPSVIMSAGVSEGPFLATGGSTFFLDGAIDNIGGSVSSTADSLLTAISGVSGDGIIARAKFKGLSAGSSSINLFNVVLLDSSLSGIEVNVQGSTVVSGVPEPSAVLLLASGLALALRLGRRKI